MGKPVIWTVDDDPDVLRAVERDLRRHYGDRYRVISADSGVSALEATKQLKLRNETVALFLVDQRMPRMSGIEFLEKAIELYPEAKTALLTAYADTDAAIRAINDVHIDHYLMKPWDPPEERLYGVVDDMLDDWQASYHPTFEGVRVIGNQWSSHSTEVRDFLGRNFVPHQWLNIETDETAKQLLTTTGADASSLPLVVFADGSFLGNPPTSEVARKLGLKTKAESPFYDLVVVGAGPAGLAAARSGEGRVGEEGRFRWAPDHLKKKKKRTTRDFSVSRIINNSSCEEHGRRGKPNYVYDLLLQVLKYHRRQRLAVIDSEDSRVAQVR